MASNGQLQIGELAKRTNTPTQAIRFYERIGLLKPAPRGENRYRLYTAEAVEQLRFIRRAQRMGLSLAEVAELIELAKEGACEPLRQAMEQMLARKIRETAAQIETLVRFRDDLTALHAQMQATPETCGKCGAFVPNCDCLPKPTHVVVPAPHRKRSRS
jgi:MerR family transcriptional regulator, copper efflux regulator